MAGGWHGEGVILVADDEDGVRGVAGRMLQGLGFEVLEACDGQEALEVYDRNSDRIRLVLLDFMMPRLDGAQTLALLAGRRQDLPVLLMSGYHEQEIAQRSPRWASPPFCKSPSNRISPGTACGPS